MKASELRNKKISDLETELTSLLKEQFNLRMQKKITENLQTHKFKDVRRSIARVKTILHEKQDTKVKEGS